MAVPYPPITIEAPQVERYSGGLYAVAPPQQGPVSDGNPNRWENGVQYRSEACADATTWAVTCGTDPAREAKVPDLGLPTVLGTPFVAYLGVLCSLPGWTLEEFGRSVRNALEACEQRAIEQTFWTGDMGNDPHLANGVFNSVTNPDGVHVLAGSGVTAVSVVDGVSALESWLGDNYCGVGVLHSPTAVAAYAANQYLLNGVNPRLTTPLGHRWAFGAGYSVNTGPDGTPAPAGTAWIYATGQVNIWRSPIWMQPDQLEYAFNTRTNDVELFAERTFVIAKECAVAAVRVTLDCAC